MTATDAALIALGERFEKLLLEHTDAWLEWAPRIEADVESKDVDAQHHRRGAAARVNPASRPRTEAAPIKRFGEYESPTPATLARTIHRDRARPCEPLR